MLDNTITLTGVVRRFGEICAVEDLTLSVPRGSIYAFLGPNGAGKTTTIRMLLGLMRPDRGEIRVFGERMNSRSRLTLLRRIGSLVEAPSLYPHLSGYENLQVTQRLISVAPSHIDRFLHIVRLENDSHRLVKTYSQGMRQRLGVAVALLAEPELLILDEPTNGLDPAGLIEMRELIRRLPDEIGATIFLSSHLLAEVEQIATHVGVIGRGRLLFEGTLDALRSRSRNRVVIEIDDASAASDILTRSGWTSKRVDDRSVAADLPDRESIARAAAAIVSAGVRLYQIQTERQSLEELFLDLTKEAGLGSSLPEEIFHA